MKISVIKKVIRANFKQLMLVFIAFFVMVFMSCLYVIRVVKREISADAERATSIMVAEINASLRELEVSTLIIALAVQERLDNRQTYEEIERFMANLNSGMVESESNISGFILMGGLIRGRFGVGPAYAPPEGYQPQLRPWYTSARRANGRVAFAGAYVDARTGQRVVTFSKVLIGSNGEDYGVLFLDMELNSLSRHITSRQFMAGGYGLVVAEDGTFVMYPDESRLGKPVEAISEGHAKILKQMAAGVPIISEIELINSAGQRMVTFFQKATHGWYIGMAVPYSSHYGDLYSMIAILAMTGLLMTLLLDSFLIRVGAEKMRSDEESVSKSSFLARMSHEMRTPLNTIIGMSELIAHREVPREMFEYVSTIQQAGSNLLSIINDVLDFSKIEAGQLSLVSERYYFASLIYDVVNLTRARLADRQLAFSVKVDSNIPEQLIGDEIRTRQILLNLLSNAVKYTYSGHIALEIRFEDIGEGKIRLEFIVEDSGIGIRRKDLDKLFGDFVRIEDIRMREVEGTGLGLAITRSFCRAMDGDVSVKSEYGRGSSFAATVIQAVKPGSDKKLASVDNAENCRVLIFEERPIYLSSLMYALTNLGIKPVCAQNFADFTGKLEKSGYDYAFVTSGYIADSVFCIGKSQSRTVLVNMVEMNDVSAYRDINSVTMPVFCINVANTLNGVRNEDITVRKRRLSFKAPDAKVLIVDDISTNLRVSKELLALYGLEAHTCLSGPEAINLARVNRYDIIFMDHMMPGMDGVEATAAIRAIDPYSEYYQTLPIIALTANAVSGQREMFLKSGMNDFLAKPIDLQKLNSILQKWLPQEKQLSREGMDSDTSATSTKTSPVDFFGLLDVPGLSVEEGLNNSGGSVAAYLDILAVFCMDANEKVQQIEQCVEQGDLGLYMTLVHALKSASRSIGAMEFGDFAARMEEASRAGDAEAVARETGAFLSGLCALRDSIQKSLGQSLPEPSQDGEDLTEDQMETLRSALTGMDIAAANRLVVEYMALPLNQRARKDLSELENHILLFDYDKAIEKIKFLGYE
ncbi:MAG: response regulator [Synergistaceae bacterium]|jgi:signal transduction histidine kinase/CheY-like chemotaxis protein/HPt (histidine-containing phosphotransfer) domain-containing protein|nr:response regulator [Synergistaceae bacterium]